MIYEHRIIEIPAGLVMVCPHGDDRTYPTPLRFKAKREVNEEGKPVDDVWWFHWLSKLYFVRQSDVKVVNEC